MKRADLHGRGTIHLRKSRPKKQTPKRYEKYTAKDWVSGAITFLRAEAKRARKERRFEDASTFIFAKMMVYDAFEWGRPGLICGMYYTLSWRWWMDVLPEERNSA